MNIKKLLLIIISTVLIIFLAYGIWTFFILPQKKPLFHYEKPQVRNISQVIKSTGELEAEDTLRIGSIIPGVIRKMYYEENDFVKRGSLLALIDDGKEDTIVKETKALLEQAREQLKFQESFYKRQKALYAQQFISQNFYEEVTRDYHVAIQEVENREALYERAVIEFNNKRITAPEDGIIIGKVSTEGETVTLSSPATIIYTIAQDIRRMEAKVEIDEANVGNVKDGMEAILTFDTYPYKKFKGIITKVSNSPIKKSGTVSYAATVPLNNKKLLFRPGMTVNAKIMVVQKKEVLTIPSHILKINRKALKEVANHLGIKIQELSPEQRESLSRKQKPIWLYKNNTFIETPVKIGAFDNAFYEVLDGLTPNDQIVVDTIEPDSMKAFFSRFFGKGLQE